MNAYTRMSVDFFDRQLGYTIVPGLEWYPADYQDDLPNYQASMSFISRMGAVNPGGLTQSMGELLPGIHESVMDSMILNSLPPTSWETSNALAVNNRAGNFLPGGFPSRSTFSARLSAVHEACLKRSK